MPQVPVTGYSPDRFKNSNLIKIDTSPLIQELSRHFNVMFLNTK